MNGNPAFFVCGRPLDRYQEISFQKLCRYVFHNTIEIFSGRQLFRAGNAVKYASGRQQLLFGNDFSFNQLIGDIRPFNVNQPRHLFQLLRGKFQSFPYCL